MAKKKSKKLMVPYSDVEKIEREFTEKAKHAELNHQMRLLQVQAESAHKVNADTLAIIKANEGRVDRLLWLLEKTVELGLRGKLSLLTFLSVAGLVGAMLMPGVIG